MFSAQPDKVSIEAVRHRTPYGSRQTGKQLFRYGTSRPLPQVLIVGNDSLAETAVQSLVFHVPLSKDQFIAEMRPSRVGVRETGRDSGH